MVYMRIDRNKFWGWVVAGLIAGMLVASGAAWLLGGSTRTELASLRSRVNGGSTAASATADLQAQLTSAEASVTELTTQNASLASQLTAAQAQVAALKKGGSSASTTTSATISIRSRTVSPSTVATGGAITLTVHMTGHPDSVTMRVYNASRSFDKTYTLSKVATAGNLERWQLTTTAPKNKGTYSYFATATLGSRSVTMPGSSPSHFTVE